MSSTNLSARDRRSLARSARHAGISLIETLVGVALLVIAGKFMLQNVKNTQTTAAKQSAETLAKTEVQQVIALVNAKFRARSNSITPSFSTGPVNLSTWNFTGTVFNTLVNGHEIRFPNPTNNTIVSRLSMKAVCQTSPSTLSAINFATISFCGSSCPAGMRPVIVEKLKPNETLGAGPQVIFPVSYRSDTQRDGDPSSTAIAMTMCAKMDAGSQELIMDVTAYTLSPNNASTLVPYTQRAVFANEQ